mgnify:CR=1 FL=1
MNEVKNPSLDRAICVLEKLLEMALIQEQALAVSNRAGRLAVHSLSELAKLALNEVREVEMAWQPEQFLLGSLSLRERQVLGLVAEGLTNKEVAYRLGISERTIQFHLNSVFNKLGVNSRTEAVAKAFRMGVL